MKWTNPGKQLDTLGMQYLKVKNIYIYGTDENAEKTFSVLNWLGIAEEFNIFFVHDATSMQLYCTKRIVSFQELCRNLRRAPDENVVALFSPSQVEEAEELKSLGLSNIFYISHAHKRHDNFIQNFLCIWLMYNHGKLLSHWTNFRVTSRCNLNCNGCLNFNKSIKNPRDITFAEFKEHIDTVFSKFDYLYSFHFCGGEPLLIKELPKFIRYLENNYKDRIFEFFVITNSTLVPGTDVIDAMKSMNGYFNLDDYSASTLNSKVEKIENLLKNNKIHYVTNKSQYWYDLDIENADNSLLSDDELEKHKDDCQSFLHEFFDKKIYSCCFQIYASGGGYGQITANDYIEIADTSKMEILEFRQGYTYKGYVDFCKRCRGIGNNAKRIPPAVQLPRKAHGHIKQEYSKTETLQEVVSICVPIYNTSRYLTRCIDSLTRQTYQSLEIILVNDGSTDGCDAICDAYARLDSRVIVVHKENGGEASARNAGLLAATGNYLMFIDSDDEYMPNAVEQLVNVIIKFDNVDLAIGGYLEKSNNIVQFATGHVQQFSARDAARSQLTSGCPYGSGYILSTVNAKLFRRELVIKNSISFDERFVIGNDTIFISEYLKYTRVIHDIFTPIYIYYKYNPSERLQGMAFFYPDAFFFYAYCKDKILKIAQFDKDEFEQFVKKEYIGLLYALIYALSNEDKFKNSIIQYLQSIYNEIDFFHIGARLDLRENRITNHDVKLPTKIISYLIINNRLNELYTLLKMISISFNMSADKQEHVRLMVADTYWNIEIQNTLHSGDFDLMNDSRSLNFIDHGLLVEQINEITTNTINLQQQVKSYSTTLTQTQTELAQTQTELAQTQTELAQAQRVLNHPLVRAQHRLYRLMHFWK